MKNFYNVAHLCLLAPVLVGSQSQYTYNYNQVRPVRRLESGLIHKKRGGLEEVSFRPFGGFLRLLLYSDLGKTHLSLEIVQGWGVNTFPE